MFAVQLQMDGFISGKKSVHSARKKMQQRHTHTHISRPRFFLSLSTSMNGNTTQQTKSLLL